MGSNFRALGIPPTQLDWATLGFGPWTPDLMALNSPGAREALGVIPNEEGYIPFKDIVVQSGLSTPEECRGAYMMVSRLGQLQLFTTTVTNIYVRESGAFTSLWAGGPVDDNYYHFRFIEFGDNLIVIHPQNNTLYTNTATLSPMVELGVGNPAPQSVCGARVGDFVVLGNLTVDWDDGNSYQPQRIRWSPFNNPNGDWTTDPATQADFQDMPSEGGAVMAIIGREVGTIFQERMISRMRYVGLPNVFEIETIEAVRGALCTGGVVNVGSIAFFIAEDGFFLWNGVNSVPISDNKVSRYFFDKLVYEWKDKIVGALDDMNSCVWWAFPTISDELDEIIIYSYKDGRWSHVIKRVEYLLSVYKLPDDDIAVFRPTQHQMAGFVDRGGGVHGYVTFTGPAVEATLDTGDNEAPSSDRIFVNNVRPIVDSSELDILTYAVLRDQRIGGTETVVGPVAQEADGTAPIEAEGRYMRARIVLSYGSDWQHAKGVEVARTVSGKF